MSGAQAGGETGGSIIDISPPIHPGIAVWPGDVRFRREVALDMAEGANLTLSSVTTTVHVGAHADARSHYLTTGDDIASHPLEPYLGPCEVIAVELERGARIRPEHLPATLRAPRVLFKTGSFPNPDDFNEDFNALSPELIAELARRGVVLAGIDTPSIDLFHDKVLATHEAIARHGVMNLEGLVLKDVEPGVYQLIALPLKLVGADAAPVRAVLIARERDGERDAGSPADEAQSPT